MTHTVYHNFYAPHNCLSENQHHDSHYGEAVDFLKIVAVVLM